ncbi:MAG: RNA polymerase sigma factor [Gemmatimonadaceae bacterium]|nr:RNA polymerase sigma factor [Gemmatimonadaceae bacterium]
MFNQQEQRLTAIVSMEQDGALIDSLVEQVLAGDERAFVLLVRRLQPAVHRWALGFSPNADDADDIVQEVFVTLLGKLKQYRGAGSMNAWLYSITRRASSRARRKIARRARLAAGSPEIPDRLVYQTDPGGRVDRERLGAVIRTFWQELPERQRTVMDLVDLQGYSPTEAAQMLELNAATLRANLFKARASMRSRLLSQFPQLAEWRDAS